MEFETGAVLQSSVAILTPQHNWSMLVWNVSRTLVGALCLSRCDFQNDFGQLLCDPNRYDTGAIVESCNALSR